mmetsp:Transcript_2709/g.6827  ORF Transcript_2709/g.6827 Transcript_2709/m.6827 type:complete len:222 (+) Transcript_2709:205-870(+)
MAADASNIPARCMAVTGVHSAYTAAVLRAACTAATCAVSDDAPAATAAEKLFSSVVYRNGMMLSTRLNNVLISDARSMQATLLPLRLPGVGGCALFADIDTGVASSTGLTISSGKLERNKHASSAAFGPTALACALTVSTASAQHVVPTRRHASASSALALVLTSHGSCTASPGAATPFHRSMALASICTRSFSFSSFHLALTTCVSAANPKFRTAVGWFL